MHILIDIYIKGKNEKVICFLTGEVNEEFVVEMEGYSNNQCEWKAVVKAMDIISGQGYEETNIHIDSVLVCDQVNFRKHIKDKKLKQIYFEWNKYKNILSGREIRYLQISGSQNPARELL